MKKLHSLFPSTRSIGRSCGIFALAVVFALTASHRVADANLIINGSFESYGGTGFNSNTGQGLTNWVIGNSGGIDIVVENPPNWPNSWEAADGNVSLSLNWRGPERISQTLTTTAGQQYEIRFSMAAEIFGGPASRSLNVLWNNSTVGSSVFNYTGQTATTMGWTEFAFFATGTGTDVIAFQSTTSGSFGPALDNVRVTAVPEPTSVLLIGVAGLGILPFRRRNRP